MATPPPFLGPGRLTDPSMKFFQEPRAHPKLVETFRAFGVDGSQPSPFEGLSATELASSKTMAKSHAATSKLYEILPNDLPGDGDEDVEESTSSFFSFDGAERKLYVFKPGRRDGGLPCVIYIHGGAMVVGDTANKVHMRWCRSIASQGVIAIAADFRNAWTPQGHNPFPIGLNDCAAAVQHIYRNRSELGISKIILQGESGGANLSIATALKAKKEEWVEQIAGVYGCVPYISNGYGWDDARKIRELPSLYECDGYFLHCNNMAGMGTYYSGDDDKENPLAWPYYASVEDCVGLPPHILSMDELDPLRDEGMAFYRKLLAAGVEVAAQVNLGVVHATSLIFRKLLPEVHNKAVRDIAAFAKSL